MKKLQARQIIITGASTGIGREAALCLAKLGHQVIAVARSEELLLSLQALCPEQIRVVAADLSKEEGRFRVKAALSSENTGVYLINNAAVAEAGLLKNLTEENWDKHFNLNVKAVVFLVKLLKEHLVGGRVLNISTGLAHSGMQGLMAYSASKAALMTATECLNLELEQDKILCATLLTGIVDTPMQKRLREYSADIFPNTAIFKGFHNDKVLSSPAVVAEFMVKVLLESADDHFAREWERL
jgi:NAD(P)-dependent dehydrogenase (short-subunit alcohol dehydrogenase family)